MISFNKIPLGAQVVLTTKEPYGNEYMFKYRGYYKYLNGLVVRITNKEKVINEWQHRAFDFDLSGEIVNNSKIPSKQRQFYQIGKLFHFKNIFKEAMGYPRYGSDEADEQINLRYSNYYNEENIIYPVRFLRTEPLRYKDLMNKIR